MCLFLNKVEIPKKIGKMLSSSQKNCIFAAENESTDFRRTAHQKGIVYPQRSQSCDEIKKNPRSD